VQKAKIRYNVPISFAFEDKNHLSVQSERDDLFRFNISPKWTLQAGPPFCKWGSLCSSCFLSSYLETFALIGFFTYLKNSRETLNLGVLDIRLLWVISRPDAESKDLDYIDYIV